MVDGEITSTLAAAGLSDNKVHRINSQQLLTHLEFMALSFTAILL